MPWVPDRDNELGAEHKAIHPCRWMMTTIPPSTRLPADIRRSQTGMNIKDDLDCQDEHVSKALLLTDEERGHSEDATVTTSSLLGYVNYSCDEVCSVPETKALLQNPPWSLGHCRTMGVG
jgi:hypothetical protein